MNGLYDPLNYGNLMAGLAAKINEVEMQPLSPRPNVHGPGVYVLYYRGDHEAYGPISCTEKPIYVGKAAPSGGRKGKPVDTDAPAIQSRLKSHARSIASVDLRLEDFTCRCLPVVPVWINLAERFLVEHYQPIWNQELDGFGNNPQGKHRAGGEASWWDTLHPGRSWADEHPRGKKTREEALHRAAVFYSKLKP